MIDDFKSMSAAYGSKGTYETAVLSNNVDGSGGITIGWNSDVNTTIPFGTSVTYKDTKYSLLEPYSPRRASAVSFRYEPTFKHPLARLDRIPFYIKSIDANQVEVMLSTTNFTGYAKDIADKLAAFFEEYGSDDIEFASTFGKWTAELNAPNTIITVNFDGCSIRSAASRIADAVGCNVFFDWNVTNEHRTIRFIAGSTIDGASYNCLHVLGGTTNMARKTLRGQYAPVIQRLTLPSTYNGIEYPNSMIDRSGGGIRLTQEIILDDIYPKMELIVDDVRARYCYLTDEDGNRIADTVDGSGNPLTYKQYAKYYIKLKHTNNTPYVFDRSLLITGKPLGILFQPSKNAEDGTCPLAGRSFDLTYFAESVTEWEEDDVQPQSNAFMAEAGEFRIIFKAEGDTIIPSLTGIVPQKGNRVTLLNMALSDTYVENAQVKLLEAGLEIMDLMQQDNGQYSGTVIGNVPAIGSPYTIDGHTGVVVSVSHDLDTDVAEVTVGSWTRKTLKGGVRDKIESVTVGSGSPTVNEEAKAGTSASEVAAIRQTMPKSTTRQQLEALGTDIQLIKTQADQQFNIWFGSGTPTASNSPASSWTTDEDKALHVQDIYYDTQRQAASTGGRAWRWVKDGNTYKWEQITDADTIAALEKIADVASDGILSGGSEKSRIFAEWSQAAYDYLRMTGEATDYGVDSELTDYESAYWELWEMLNGGVAHDSNTDPQDTPDWLSDLQEDTDLSDYSITPAAYRAAWDAYYEAEAALKTAITQQGKALTAAAIGSALTSVAYSVSVDVPEPPYKAGDLWLKIASQNATEGILYKCINTVSSGSASMDDWEPVRISSGITSLLADLAEKWESYVSGKYTAHTITSLKVFLQSDQPTGTNGDLWYDGSSLKAYDSGWSTETNTDYANATVYAILDSIMGYLGETSFTFRKQLDAVSRIFDVCFARSTFNDTLTGTSIDGSLAVWVRGLKSWEHVRDNTEGLLKNYGDKIVAAVYGNSTLAQLGLQSYAAGFTTCKNFAQIFAQATDVATGQTALAAIKTLIERDSQGNPTGLVEVIGKFRSASRFVLIEDKGSDYFKEAAIRIVYPSEDQPLDLYQFVNIHGDQVMEGVAKRTRSGIIELTGEIRSSRDRSYTKAVLSNDTIACSKFSIAYDFNPNIEDGELKDVTYQTVDGVGSYDSPETFTTADGKTVTVMGGIITDIS